MINIAVVVRKKLKKGKSWFLRTPKCVLHIRVYMYVSTYNLYYGNIFDLNSINQNMSAFLRFSFSL